MLVMSFINQLLNNIHQLGMIVKEDAGQQLTTGCRRSRTESDIGICRVGRLGSFSRSSVGGGVRSTTVRMVRLQSRMLVLRKIHNPGFLVENQVTTV